MVGAQLSFFGSERLFTQRVLGQYLADKSADPIHDALAKARIIDDWVRSIPKSGATEPSLEQAFNSTILGGVLGYTLWPAPGATARPKPPSGVTGTGLLPDAILGLNLDADPQPIAVVELKAPGVALDAPQSRADRKTPVEQAFDYAEAIFGIRWILVSDMQLIRLYSVESRSDYELFNLASCLSQRGEPTPEFQKLISLLHHDNLVRDGVQSPVNRLFTKSLERQLLIRTSFYDLYYRIRRDLMTAVRNALMSVGKPSDSDTVLEAVQRLLDRMMFLSYCEDHPDQLIPRDTIRSVTQSARSLPGSSDHRVYDSLKSLFREVDEGSPQVSGLRLSAYNGELFKHHNIDEINLPDSLHDTVYPASDPDGQERRVQGVWGLHQFDFWQELNEHLLGHIFEESLSDIGELRINAPVEISEKLKERRRWGIYYTSQLLSDFMVFAVLQDHVAEVQSTPSRSEGDDEAGTLSEQMDRLTRLKIIDLACGSGAFLVSALRELQKEHVRLQSAITDLRRSQTTPQFGLEEFAELSQQSGLLRQGVYGVDLLPQAVELAKLALWLRSARKGEKVADLSRNIVAGDSLRVGHALEQMGAGPGTFDIVVGNPPWGGEVDTAAYRAACATLGIPATTGWDTWELFVLLGLHTLKDGGRLAFVIPDTFFSPAKERIRRILLDQTIIERLHNLGPDWFGPNVRMGTAVIQLRKGAKAFSSDITSLLLTGDLRRRAIKGEVPLRQLERTFARQIPQERSEKSSAAEIEIFRSRLDDDIMTRMESLSFPLSNLCTRARGEEMAKTGLLWRCPN